MELRELAESDEDLGAEHYMLLSLDLANWRVGEDLPDAANRAWERLSTDMSKWVGRWKTVRMDRSIAVLPEAVQHGKRVRSAIEKFGSGRHKPALRATADAAVEDIQVSTKLRVSERGTLEHIHTYAAGSRDGPLGLFLAFLLDPNRRFGADLRQCRLPTCRRYFFVPLNRKGGRIPAYCPGTDHQRRHDSEANAPKRARKHRAKHR
jgi:hypothetical protein